MPPRWPPSLPEGEFSRPEYEIAIVDSSTVSFVTNRLLKLDISRILDKREKEPTLAATQNLAALYNEFSTGPLEEFDWSRLNKLEFQDLLRQRIGLSDRLSKLGCQLCDEFDDHVGVMSCFKRS